MSQHSENDSDDDDCEYFLQPVSNQYNITEKIKEANQQLYKAESLQRSSQPKVRFRDHQLVDYEPATDDEAEDDGTDIMERRSNSSNNSKRDDESSDDGYIDDETLEASCDERLIIEAIEIEEVSEQIEILQVTTSSSDNITEPNVAIDEQNYDEEFDDEADTNMSASTRKSSLNGIKTSSSTKKIFYSKINPINGSDGEHIIRKTTKKDCCQYKETDEYKKMLPKYNGFYSHYGLSKDEYERRQNKQLEKYQQQHRRRSRHIEQKEFLAKENEKVFAKWLYKKMRNSMSKTNPTNMYDIKPSALMRKQRKQERKQQRQTIQRQMETDESCDASVNEEEDDEDVGEEEQEEDEENLSQQLNNE
ncbi:hypothetical protein PVAND_004284 [Polypedilum vanderplanki]|uniref:Coiled-coil domain-containing protein 181 n=1 Tax=Polypedilum vanderplanki TaxID=319348 RepID=A0A9J6BX39_POLVA|nr:hypothetical protein PVAND_004284 [Polypedilum vanderplanki]